jgi:hypothetical protein
MILILRFKMFPIFWCFLCLLIKLQKILNHILKYIFKFISNLIYYLSFLVPQEFLVFNTASILMPWRHLPLHVGNKLFFRDLSTNTQAHNTDTKPFLKIKYCLVWHHMHEISANQEAKAGGLDVQAQPGLPGETPSQTTMR